MPNYFRFVFSLLVLLFWQVAYVEKRELYGHFPSVRLDWTHEEGREECNNDNNELAEGEVNKVSSDEKQYSFLAPKRSRFKLTTLNWRTIERRRIRPATGCWKEEKKRNVSILAKCNFFLRPIGKMWKFFRFSSLRRYSNFNREIFVESRSYVQKGNERRHVDLTIFFCLFLEATQAMIDAPGWVMFYLLCT